VCGICDIVNKEDEQEDLFTENEIENILLGVYYGVYGPHRLDVGMYLKIAKRLFSGVEKGYKKTFIDLISGSEDYIMLKALQENVYIFSAAKEYQQLVDMSKLLVGNNRVTNFNDFKKAANVIFETYNKDWLRTEYNSAIAQSRTASQWQDIVKQQYQFPMLTYQTAGDSRVRPTHAELDNISRPVNDKFWDNYMPPNGWNCRCHVEQNDTSTKTNLQGFKQPSDVPDIFMFNAGKEKIIFSKKHPYFNVKDVRFAKQNFGMPMPTP